MSDYAVVEEVVSAGPLLELAAVLDIDPPASLVAGHQVPPLWHWVLFHRPVRRAEIGPDGHRLNDVPTSPGGGYARVYAGGRVVVHEPLLVGEPAHREARTISRVEKQGRSGPGILVSVGIEVRQRDRVAVEEQIDLYYRPRPEGERRTPPAPVPGPDASASGFLADPATLFRFSAVTANAHRIHYDAEFARLDGHPGPLVHGPLQALLLSEYLRTSGAWTHGAAFEYRLVAPSYVGARLRVRADDGGVSLRDHRDVTTASGRLVTP